MSCVPRLQDEHPGYHLNSWRCRGFCTRVANDHRRRRQLILGNPWTKFTGILQQATWLIPWWIFFILTRTGPFWFVHGGFRWHGSVNQSLVTGTISECVWSWARLYGGVSRIMACTERPLRGWYLTIDSPWFPKIPWIDSLTTWLQIECALRVHYTVWSAGLLRTFDIVGKYFLFFFADAKTQEDASACI